MVGGGEKKGARGQGLGAREERRENEPMESQLFPALFVLTPLGLGIGMLLVIWYRRGREY